MVNVFEAISNYITHISWGLTYQNVVNFCLGVFLFLLLVIIGGILSKFIRGLVERVLVEKLKLDDIMKKHGLDDALGSMKLSGVIGTIMMWLVFLIFLTEGLRYLNLGQVSTILIALVNYIPQIIYAIIIAILGLLAADWITDRLIQGPSKSQQIIAMVIKPIIIFFTLIIAGEQLGFQLDFLMDTIKWSLIGIVWGIALALGLAIGLGFGLDKKMVPRMLDKFLKSNVKK